MIKIDSNRLRNETKPKITNAISNLNQASGLLKGLKIPSNFCYLSDLKGIPSQIEQIVTDVKGINTYINQKTAEFDAVRNARVPIGLGAGANVLNYEYNLTTAKKIGASTANTFISIVKGIADFGESLIDTAAVVTSVPLTVLTVGQDIAQSLKAGKGLLDIDFKNTKDLWAGTMSMVAEDTVGNAFSKFYEKTKVGRWLDTNAYTPFKSGGAVTKVAEGIGQIAGVVALTVLTCGAGTGAAGATTAAKAAATKTAVSSAIAGARGFGESVEYLWSKQRDSSWVGLERKKDRGEISQETIDFYKQLTEISSDDLFNLYVSNQISLDDYNDLIQLKTQLDAMPEDWINVKNALGGLGYATAIGGWEALQFYVGNKMNGFKIDRLSPLKNSAIRVGVDSIFNATDTLYRTGTESILTGRDFRDIFREQGGTGAIISNLFVGLIGSSLGEYADYKSEQIKTNNMIRNLEGFRGLDEDKLVSLRKQIKEDLDKGILKQESFEILDDDTFINQYNARHPDTMDVYNCRDFKTDAQIAEYFKDPKGYVASSIVYKDQMGNPLRDNKGKLITLAAHMSDLQEEDVMHYYKYLDSEQKNVFISLLANAKKYSDEDVEILRAYSHALGPVLTAESRQSDVKFEGGVFKGQDRLIEDPYGYTTSFDRYIERGYVSANGVLPHDINTTSMMRRMNDIIESQDTLNETIVVRRNVEGLFQNGEMIDLKKGNQFDLNIGVQFNDRALEATTVGPSYSFANRKIHLEIEVPPGTNAAYIESAVVGKAKGNFPSWTGTNYHQQEFVIGRNNAYEIIDITPILDKDELVVRARVVPTESSLIKQIELKNIQTKDTAMNYYNRYGINTIRTQQVDLYDATQTLKDKGLLSAYEAEVRDMRNSHTYGQNIAEHGIDHAEKVLFNAMLIGNDMDFDDREMRLLTEAAKFHDSGRVSKGPGHGISGAKTAGEYLLNATNTADNQIIQAAIEYHAIDDDPVKWNEIMKKYNISNSDKEIATKVVLALKDADALDRTRFPGNLNTQSLRTDSANKFVQASYQLQEMRGTYSLQGLNDPGNVISNLRASGYSDYEISFWIKYRK